MKNIINKIINFSPYLIIVILIGGLFIFINDLTYDQFLKFVEIMIWPAIVLLALLFFKKVFTYLFFSMEEFNFFGTKGRLKNVEEVIQEKAQELYENRERERELTEKENFFKKQIENLQKEKQTTNEEWYKFSKKVSDEWYKFSKDRVDDYKKLSNEYKDLLKTRDDLKKQISALLNQIQELQKQIINRS